MKIKFIEDGNLTFSVRLLLALAGTGLVILAIKVDLPIILARVFFFVGFAIALVGGMASRAKLLRIRPFDNRY